MWVGRREADFEHAMMIGVPGDGRGNEDVGEGMNGMYSPELARLREAALMWETALVWEPGGRGEDIPHRSYVTSSAR